MALDTLHKLHQQSSSAEVSETPRAIPVKQKPVVEYGLVEEVKDFCMQHKKIVLGGAAISMALGAFFGVQSTQAGNQISATPPAESTNPGGVTQPESAKSFAVTFHGIESENGCLAKKYTVQDAVLRTQANGYTQELIIRDMDITTQTCAPADTHVIQKDGAVIAGTQMKSKKVALDVTDMTYSAAVENADIQLRTVPPGEALAEKGLDKVLCPQLGLWGCPGHDNQPETAKLQPEVQQSLILSAEAAVLQAVQNYAGTANYAEAVSALRSDIEQQVIAQGGTSKMVTVTTVDAKGKVVKKVPNYMSGVLAVLQQSGAAITPQDHAKLFGDSLKNLSKKVQGL